MRTVVTLPNLADQSWSNDFTVSQNIKRQYMYVQCLGHYHAKPEYRIMHREKLHSCLLIYTLHGFGNMEYMGKKTLLTPGSLILINCEQPHSYYNSTDEIWEFEWIHFSGNCIDGYLNEIWKNWDKIESEKIADWLHEIVYYTDDSEKSSEILCSTAVLTLCSNYLLTLKRSSEQNDQEISPFVRDAADYIEEHFSSEISLDSMCKELHISKSYLGHTFKQQLGQSPYEYLINMRLTFAKSLLRNTDQSIASIAEQSGFYSSSYFIQTFKKHEDLTPLQYRRYFVRMEERTVPYET